MLPWSDAGKEEKKTKKRSTDQINPLASRAAVLSLLFHHRLSLLSLRTLQLSILRSIRKVSTPPLARVSAAQAPEGPPPITATRSLRPSSDAPSRTAARAATEAREEDASLRTALTDAIEGTAETEGADATAAAADLVGREMGAATEEEDEPAAAETLRCWTARAPEARRVEAAIVLSGERD